jgi:hypothetical protein
MRPRRAPVRYGLLAESARVSKVKKHLVITMKNGVIMSIPLERIHRFDYTNNDYLKVEVHHDGMSMCFVKYEIDFCVDEMVPDYVGILSAQVAEMKAAAKRERASKGPAKRGRPRKS